MAEPSPTTAKPSSPRLTSVDAYRGLVMFLMMAEVLRLGQMARNFPESSFWQFLAFHQSHVEWRGCSLHDLIQPSFSFLVGVALPFSLAARMGRGQPFWLMTLHALWRAIALILLGIFLRSMNRPQTNFTFEDTLSQIGLGYFFLYLIGLTRPKWHWLAFVVILLGVWAAFVLYPLPGGDFDFQKVGVPANWPHHTEGFARHWDKNANLAWAFDTWFLNLWPRPQPFTHNGGGYATLSFIPTLATMILGLIAGTWLKAKNSTVTNLGLMIMTGVGCLVLGTLLDRSGFCPSVKRIWTPAWVLVSGGWCLGILAGFYLVMDLFGLQSWAFPLRVIGMNSIAAYCLSHRIDPLILGAFKTHLGLDMFQIWGPAYEPLVSGAAILGVTWLILFWLYRRGVFIRI